MTSDINPVSRKRLEPVDASLTQWAQMDDATVHIIPCPGPMKGLWISKTEKLESNPHSSAKLCAEASVIAVPDLYRAAFRFQLFEQKFDDASDNQIVNRRRGG